MTLSNQLRNPALASSTNPVDDYNDRMTSFLAAQREQESRLSHSKATPSNLGVTPSDLGVTPSPSYMVIPSPVFEETTYHVSPSRSLRTPEFTYVDSDECEAM